MIDLTQFRDELAMKILWNPLVPGGANFVTHRLAQKGARFEMKPSVALRLFGLVFLAVGLVLSGVGAVRFEPFLFLFGLPFAAVGVYVHWQRPMIFDADTRTFSSKKGTAPFSQIHALQVISERVESSEDPDFTSYELNLVLTSGERINVVDHQGLTRIRADAASLSAMIGCKVWDTTSLPTWVPESGPK